jgi:hypothetical protein
MIGLAIVLVRNMHPISHASRPLRFASLTRKFQGPRWNHPIPLHFGAWEGRRHSTTVMDAGQNPKDADFFRFTSGRWLWDEQLRL